MVKSGYKPHTLIEIPDLFVDDKDLLASCDRGIGGSTDCMSSLLGYHFDYMVRNGYYFET